MKSGKKEIKGNATLSLIMRGIRIDGNLIEKLIKFIERFAEE